MAAKVLVAIFAGGCFWCMQPPFDRTPGVVRTEAGYTGGRVRDPGYEQVSSGETGHAEAVRVFYDPAKVSYDKLLDVFWRSIDPTAKDRQFADAGTQYRTAVFYLDPGQKRSAEESKKRLAASGKFKAPIVTEIVPAGEFYPAEDYHQDYYKKNPVRYEMYKVGSGRAGFLKKLWGSKKD